MAERETCRRLLVLLSHVSGSRFSVFTGRRPKRPWNLKIELDFGNALGDAKSSIREVTGRFLDTLRSTRKWPKRVEKR